MGSYIAWKLDADIIGAEQFIIDSANNHREFKDDKDSPRFQDFIWRKWTPEVKWWAPEFVADLSKNIDVVFRLDAKGDENFTWFFYKGQVLSEGDIWERPTFPSRPLFKKKAQEAKMKRAEKARIDAEKKAAAEKEKMQKELESLRQREKELVGKLQQKSA